MASAVQNHRVLGGGGVADLRSILTSSSGISVPSTVEQVKEALAAPAVAAAGDAIVTLDHSAKVTSWNRAAEQLLGFSREDTMEQGLVLIIPAEYRARHVAGFHAAVDSGHLAHDGAVARVEALTASGGRLVLGLSLGLLAGQDGQPSGVVGVLRPLGDAAVEFVTPEGSA